MIATDRKITLLTHVTIPTDTGLTASFSLSVKVNGDYIIFDANEFIPDFNIEGSSSFLVDSYARVRSLVLVIADAIEGADA